MSFCGKLAVDCLSSEVSSDNKQYVVYFRLVDDDMC